MQTWEQGQGPQSGARGWPQPLFWASLRGYTEHPDSFWEMLDFYMVALIVSRASTGIRHDKLYIFYYYSIIQNIREFLLFTGTLQELRQAVKGSMGLP